jgi:carbonic anhydrase
MSHHCKALILHCIDFRFHEAIKNWLKEKGLLNNCDIVSLAGASKGLISPKNSAEPEIILRQMEISSNLHKISQVILMNHTDCGAYGGRDAFASSEAEHLQHVNDMQKAKEIILNKFPELEVKIVLAKINPLEQINFEEITPA